MEGASLEAVDERIHPALRQTSAPDPPLFVAGTGRAAAGRGAGCDESTHDARSVGEANWLKSPSRITDAARPGNVLERARAMWLLVRKKLRSLRSLRSKKPPRKEDRIRYVDLVVPAQRHEELHLAQAFFDPGSQVNLIGTQFVENIPGLLRDIKPCNEAVAVGTLIGSSWQNIQSQITIRLYVRDEEVQNKKIYAKGKTLEVTFLIVDGLQHDLVIGSPTIDEHELEKKVLFFRGLFVKSQPRAPGNTRTVHQREHPSSDQVLRSRKGLPCKQEGSFS